MRRRRGWDGRFRRSRHYVEDAVRVDARAARAAGAAPGIPHIRVVVGPVAVDVALCWHQQPPAARGGGGGVALTFLCPTCLRSRRSLYFLRAVALVVACRGCLRLVYRSQGVDRLERRRRRASRLEAAKDRPRIWSSTRLRALEAWGAAERSYWSNRFMRWPAWMGPAPGVDAFWP